MPTDASLRARNMAQPTYNAPPRPLRQTGPASGNSTAATTGKHAKESVKWDFEHRTVACKSRTHPLERRGEGYQ